MRKRPLVLLLAASLPLAACVSTRQFADIEFQPPQGDYDMIVMRPSVQVGRINFGGTIEQRADWTDTSRALILAELRRQQAARGGRTLILERREDAAGFPAERIADLERLFQAVGSSIVLHRYLRVELPTKRRQGLDWTLGQDAIALGRATGMEYALFLHAQDAYATDERIALQVLGVAGCLIGFCAPQIGGGSQQAYASLVDLRTGDVVWFNFLQSQLGDLRKPEGAAQLVERLLGRMQPGRAVRARQEQSRGQRREQNQ
jgi:hypothetical protein